MKKTKSTKKTKTLSKKSLEKLKGGVAIESDPVSAANKLKVENKKPPFNIVEGGEY